MDKEAREQIRVGVLGATDTNMTVDGAVEYIVRELEELGYHKPLDRPKLREKIILLLSSGMLRSGDALNGEGELFEDDTYLFIKRKYKGVLADQIQALIVPKDKPPLLNDKEITKVCQEDAVKLGEHDIWECIASGLQATAQAQWDVWNKAIYGDD